MKKYKSYCKRGTMAAIDYHNTIAGNEIKKVSFWDISKWPQWWESGAKQLEKSAPGRLVTAPVRLPEAIISATQKTVSEIPDVVKNAGSAIPIIAITASLLGAGFLAVKFKLFDKVEHKTV
jgi:hypothetical protein